MMEHLFNMPKGLRFIPYSQGEGDEGEKHSKYCLRSPERYKKKSPLVKSHYLSLL